MRIAIDAMGGDYAPREIVAGTAMAAADLPADVEELILVGREPEILGVMPGGRLPPRVRIEPAGEVIEMGEPAAAAVRRKRDSSINRAMELVKSGVADAMFSAGNTGAVVACATLKLRTLPGVLRPAIATSMPGPADTPWVLIDAGATPDCSADLLVQFAVMGAVYAREILGIAEPRVGLLSIGGEETKGNEITREAFAKLRDSPLRFEGNVEGHDLFGRRVDVVVCDGFVGNVVLKTCESVAHFFGHALKETLLQTWARRLGALLIRRGLAELRQRADASSYGGAPLLGVRGVVIIAHGASNARAAANGIRVAIESVRRRVPEKIERGIGSWGRS
ncbi:MAG: phosphate acyltransferase PlsX [Kiritimatiellae bacterium]|nr:phosphate acyltransferase PlsX [Kiritimatiellia bacterium]